MPSHIPIPGEIESRLEALLTAQTSFPAWKSYQAGRNGILDPLSWLAKSNGAAHAEVFGQLIAKFKRPFAPLAQPSCQSSAVMLYLEAVAGAGIDLETTVAGWGPVPLCVVGHVMVFVDCDPSSSPPIGFPSHLSALVWTTIDDYLLVREDFIERAQALIPGVTPRDMRSLQPCAKGASFRDSLKWALGQPTLDSTERTSVEFVLALTDAELTPTRIASDLVCSLATIPQPGTVLVPSGFLRVDPAALAMVKQRNRCNDLGFVPYAITSKHVLVATDRESAALLDELARSFPGLKPIITRGSGDGIRYLLNEGSRSTLNQADASVQNEDLRGVEWRIDPTQFVNKNPRQFDDKIELLIQYFLADATGQRASDIHIDNFCGMTRVRYVVDGNACHGHSLPASYARTVATKLRNSYCKHGKETEAPAAPQEGSFVFGYLGKRVTCRIGIVYAFGDKDNPKIVLRILDTSAGVRDLSLLGLFPDELAIIRRNLKRRQGMIMVSGPTGSGKSTTLMSCMQDINTPDRIFYTLEDPIEYTLRGVTQLAVSSKDEERTGTRFSFAEAVRMLLRMDPDGFMIGEIRDLATANAGLEASNTGHLILATTHANNAPDIIKRLIFMGVDRASFGDNVKLLTAQRLIKRLCSCRKQVLVPDAVAATFQKNGITHGKYVCEPQGCTRCRNSGYHGRFVVLELLEMTTEIADMISDGAPSGDIRKAAKSSPGYIPLLTSALRRVAIGQTSMAAVLEVLDDA